MWGGLGRAGEGLDGSQGRVPGGHLSWESGILSEVRFCVWEESQQSEHQGGPGQGVRSSVLRCLHTARTLWAASI